MLRMSALIEKILKEGFLLEAKNIGTLYHFTSASRLLKILQGNKLEAHPRPKGKYALSTTRDKNFHITGDRMEDGIHDISVRISLNGNKISERYKIVAFNYFGQDKEDDSKVTRADNTESEEEIYTNANGLINLRNYIIEITFFKDWSTRENFIIEKSIELLKQSNIPFKIEKI